MNKKREKYITVTYAAELAGVQPNTMKKWVGRGLIKRAFPCRRGKWVRWMIPMSQVPGKPKPKCIYCGKRIEGTRYLAKAKYCSHLCKRMHYHYKKKGLPEMRKQQARLRPRGRPRKS